MSSEVFDRAVRLLKSRARSTESLRVQLLSRSYPPDQVEAALRRLTALGYLNDARYAVAKAQSLIHEGRSLADVRRRLQAAGVAQVELERAVGQAVAELGHDELAAARALVRKRRLAGLQGARFLMARGFESEVIEQALGLSWPSDG